MLGNDNDQRKASEEHLKKIRYPINFHGGSLKYPGRGGYCHAIYKAEKIYGCVAHIMSKNVDTGKIIKGLNFKISDYDTVESLKFKTYLNSLALFYEIIILRFMLLRIVFLISILYFIIVIFKIEFFFIKNIYFKKFQMI